MIDQRLTACCSLPLLFAALVIALSAQSGSAQTVARNDTARSAVPDTTALPDTMRIKSPSGIDSVVTYSATDSIVYALSRKTMYLYGNSSIKYKSMGLKAELVDINWNTSTLTARGVVDTSDTSHQRYRGLPKMIDGGETYDGSTVLYNFKSKKGRIDLGKTAIEHGLYYGEAIKRINDDVLFVGDGKFTTCDLEHPHYYFGSPEMKIRMQDQIVTRPVYMYVDDVPVFALPFGVFPAKRGRRSGLLTPAYGESRRGRYLSHLGYYWAIDDYLDLSLKGDVYSKGGYTFYSDFRYAKRYDFSGGISSSYGSDVSGEPGDPGYYNNRVYNIRMNHDQQFNPTTRLLVDFTFTSSSYYQQTTTNWNDLLRQNIVSNATLTKSWEGTPFSMTLNIQRDQNLQPTPGTVELSTVLPNVNFSIAQTYPFRSKASTAAGSYRWYEMLGISYGGQFQNKYTKTTLDAGSVNDERQGALHALSFNVSPKLGYVTITPFLNYQERWYTKHINRTYDAVDSTVQTEDVPGFTAVRTFDMGISASTKLYGIVHPEVFGIAGIRHQVTPSISYSYQPDFSDAKFGYYGRYTDATGTEQVYDKYQREIYGGAPSGKRQALSFSLGNVFEMKTMSTDSSAKENKFQLLNLNLGAGYNFAADSMRLSELGTDFRTSVGELLSVGGNARFNFYKFASDPATPSTGHRINKFLLGEEGRLADLTSFSISVATRLSGERQTTTAGRERTAEDSLRQKQRSTYSGLYEEIEPDFSIPWNLDLRWDFAQSQPNPAVIYRSSTIALSLGFNLTQFWKISATGSYDMLNKVFAAPYITVYRDLHCWEMNFEWVPTGPNRNYRLVIRLKDPMLQDLRVTKQVSAMGIY